MVLFGGGHARNYTGHTSQGRGDGVEIRWTGARRFFRLRNGVFIGRGHVANHPVSSSQRCGKKGETMQGEMGTSTFELVLVRSLRSHLL